MMTLLHFLPLDHSAQFLFGAYFDVLFLSLPLLLLLLLLLMLPSELLKYLTRPCAILGTPAIRSVA